MTAAILSGCGVGAGLSLLIVALWPAQRSLGSALATLRPLSPRTPPMGDAAGSWQAQRGQAVARH